MSDKDPLRFKDEGVGKLNDTSDVDISKLQYTSSIIEEMKKDGVYDELVKTVSALSFADKSKSFMVKIIKQKFPIYCSGLTISTFNKWLEYYLELSKAVIFNRSMCLGELVYMGMRKAELSVESGKDDFILKLMDRIDDGTLHAKNKAEIIENQSNNCSNQTINTVNRIFAESSRFGNIQDIVIDDSDEEYGDGDED